MLCSAEAVGGEIPCPQVAGDGKKEPLQFISHHCFFPLAVLDIQICDFLNSDLLPTVKHTMTSGYTGRMPRMWSSKHFQISIKFTTIHPHQRKHLFFIFFYLVFWKEKPAVCAMHFFFSARKEDKRHKGITVKKVLLTGIKLGPQRGIMCASERQLPRGCSARLIFMSQTDQRQLSLRLCISLSLPFQTPPFVLIFFACVTYCHHGHFGTTKASEWAKVTVLHTNLPPARLHNIKVFV